MPRCQLFQETLATDLMILPYPDTTSMCVRRRDACSVLL